jgi:DNA adenine methylase
MPTTDTPLRYPGGKTQLSPFVMDLLRENNLLQGVYCEPFAGGAGIALRLLLSGNVSEIWINDLDRSIYAFWHSVINHTEQLCERIESTAIDMTVWHEQKAVQARKNASQINLGFSTLFLNRTNRSGILRGGVIGGKDQEGEYPMDCRFNRVELVRKIRRIALYKDQIKLTCIDAGDYLKRELKRLPSHSLVNIDPPYYHAGPDLYTNAYKHDDHVVLSKVIRALDHKWMLTYDNTPEISALYKGFPQFEKTLTYYAQVKRSAAELLVLCPKLKVPKALLL